MGVFHIFKIVQMVLNRSKHHICKNYEICMWLTKLIIYFNFDDIFMSYVS